MNLLIAFFTGASSGSLGCLAMQGGLLTSLILVRPDPGTPREGHPPALAIGLFLVAKLAAYTALGALLGAFGSVLQLSTAVRAGLMIATGLFMVAHGLQMLDLHPFFRHVVLQPPATIRRFIRHRSGAGRGWTAPLTLGLLTIFLPCGVAQAMMAAALGTGDPRRGALLLFSFTLGSTPVFFGVVYLATRLGSALLQRATPLVALTLVGVGLVPVNQGLTLAGSPVAWSRLVDRMARPAVPPPADQGSPPAASPVIEVGASGYAPRELHVRAHQEVILTWITRGSDTCARAVVLPALHEQFLLPAQGQVPLRIPPQKPGTVFDYSCSMGMYRGRIIFDLN
ncbi:MAG: sulfite exporter TauE/SafE family protein [Geothrix sp.]|nr:sulfite exporter TauE/SafE family protein [Geothrix sp.]